MSVTQRFFRLFDIVLPEQQGDAPQSSDAHRVMPIGLLHFRDAVSSQVNLQMAGATIVIVPMLIFFLVFRKQIIAGVARGGIKG